MRPFRIVLKHVLLAGVFCTLPYLQAQQKPAERPPVGTSQEPVPSVVREAESDIKRQFRRFGAGVRAGVSMDPELLNVGLHATLGPFFDRSIAFRPNVEYGFGELTNMISLNAEAIYILPFGRDDNRRRIYVGGGPGFNFVSRGLEDQQTDDDDNDNGIDVDDYEFDTSLNVLGGVEWRSGALIELKASAYGGPAIRLLIGYTF